MTVRPYPDRPYLVTSFHCARCGKQLSISTAGAKPIETADDGITGANKREVHISLEPCRSCWDDATKPAMALRQALADAMKFDDILAKP